MSMKTKKNRWAAIALAALVVAGGTVAAPQAASAYTQTATCAKWFSTDQCATYVNAKKSVKFRLSTDSNQGSHRYTVRTPGGRLLCKGDIAPNAGSRSCWFGTYTGRVKITVENKWGVEEKIVVLR